MTATIALLIAATVNLTYVATYAWMFPWWRTAVGRSLIAWPTVVGVLTAMWAGVRLSGSLTPGDGWIIAGSILLTAASAHRLSVLIDTWRHRLDH